MVNITKSAAERDRELYGEKEGFATSWRPKTKEELKGKKRGKAKREPNSDDEQSDNNVRRLQ